MLFRIVLFILCLPPLFLIGTTSDRSAKYSKGDAPSWARSCNFPLEVVPVKPSQVNLQYLLIDTQRNWEEKTLYSHFAVKILTKTGVERVSQLNFNFDPSYAQVVVHAIRVFREEKWFDRLENSRHNLIQRESELEQNLYNGDLTLVYFLDDIREGDILEYSYSILGEQPLFASHYTDVAFLQRDFSVEKITHRLLGHPDLSFLAKPINTTVEPKIINLSPSLREWTWEAIDTPAYTYEPDQPVWYNPPAHIQMSQYKTWGEVAQKLSHLYILPPDFTQSVPSGMQALIEKWEMSTKDPTKRALLALRFVQDEVRYLGIEEGMGAFQPKDPNLTFQQRFGDCKDKTFLLHALLHLMNIPSKSVLVHSIRGQRLPSVLPIPFFFDHAILQLEIDDATYWVDPTINLQGGCLQTNFFPDYKWGLLISDNTESLTQLPEVNFKNPTNFDTSFILESEDSALLKIKSIFYDSRADRFRRSLEQNGLKKISEGSLSDMQEFYGAVTLDSPSEVLDDRENNIFTFNESYRIPTRAITDSKVMEIFSYILRNYLHDQVNPERSSPYAISYPYWVREHIHIENPFIKWEPFENKLSCKHESLLYTLSTCIEKNSADFELELQHLQDHVPLTSLREYWNVVKDINRKAPPELTIASTLITMDPVDHLITYTNAGLVLWFLLYFISRKKRLTQDLLSFHLNLCRRFYSVITAMSIMYLGDSPTTVGLTTGGIVLAACFACNYIFTQRSVIISLILQGFVAVQACLMSWLIFTTTRIELDEKILTLTVCCLYLGYSSFNLNKARLLIEGGRSASRAT